MDEATGSDAGEQRAIAAQLLNSARALQLELDEQGLEELGQTILEITERIRNAGRGAAHRAAEKDSALGLTTTVAIGLRRR